MFSYFKLTFSDPSITLVLLLIGRACDPSPLSKQYIFKTKIKDTREMKLLLLGGETISVCATEEKGLDGARWGHRMRRKSN